MIMKMFATKIGRIEIVFDLYELSNIGLFNERICISIVMLTSTKTKLVL